ncbi:hypothetical protein CI102_14281 [Trichoderma harzianum]|uniref:Uncharacterized protein n=1 Tax=Trichoderma harzianum CBS 226.95 TaxID=983964 RepID=A0A2T4ARF8_TRIHA|nr:hypothetical protein M431DRAFT_491139 [Trichoderma harzianum CBS 226.95]PKK42260.1 hypothetical protein CI102_14281 [Trichoderma harzianum]PTB59538.1 hypothetical protein M431DRAFT_491139 [Trichoderma harzianum CBS 226.95]
MRRQEAVQFTHVLSSGRMEPSRVSTTCSMNRDSYHQSRRFSRSMLQYRSSVDSRSSTLARVDHQRQNIHAMRHELRSITPTQFIPAPSCPTDSLILL